MKGSPHFVDYQLFLKKTGLFNARAEPDQVTPSGLPNHNHCYLQE